MKTLKTEEINGKASPIFSDARRRIDASRRGLQQGPAALGVDTNRP